MRYSSLLGAFGSSALSIWPGASGPTPKRAPGPALAREVRDRDPRSRLRRGGRGVGLSLAIGVAVLLDAGSVLAQVHVDIAVQENADDGRLGIHGYDFNALPQLAVMPGKRVFVRGVSISGNSLLSEDPGFVARVSETELDPVGLLPVPGSETLVFNVLSPPIPTMPELGGRNVSFWNGQGPVVWGPTPDPDEGLSIIKGSFFNPTAEIVVDGATTDVPGFVIGATTSGSTGSLHEHLKFLLLPDNGALPPVGPDDGVYLMLIELSLAPYAEWIPVFLGIEAFAGGSATQQAAIAAVESELLRPLCSDGIDNDKDGLVDWPGDPGCDDPEDMSERGAVEECDNGLDDDADGPIDFPNDPGCLHPTQPIEAPEPAFATMLLVGGLGLVGLSRRRAQRLGIT